MSDHTQIRHPAPFSASLLPVFAELLDGRENVLDPFGGIGRVHLLRDHLPIQTVAVELEPEWANTHPDTLVGDARELPFEDNAFSAICTSPCYGNRLADHHVARDGSRRHTYRHALGRALSDGNAGMLQWGPKYRAFHEDAWEEAVRVLAPGGLFVLNISDHIRGGRHVDVAAWHLSRLLKLGLSPCAIRPVVTRRMRHGANRQVRVPAELVIALEKSGS